MSSRDFEFKIDHGGAQALLTSPEVTAHLAALAQQVAAELAPQFQAHLPGQTLRVEVDSNRGQRRASATVLILHPAAVRIERKHGYAASALRGR